MMGDDFFDPLDQNVEGYLSLFLRSNRFLVKGDALVVTAKTAARMKTSEAGFTSRRLRHCLVVVVVTSPILQEPREQIHCHGREN